MQAMTELLYDAALVTSGFVVESPKVFGDRIFDLMGSVLCNGHSNSGTEQRRAQRRANASATAESPASEPISADSVIPPSEGAAGGSSPWGN